MMNNRSPLTLAILCVLLSLNMPVWAYNSSPIQGLHLDIQSQMEEEEPKILPQVDILWRSTLMRNATLQLALQKMAEKSGQAKPQVKTKWTTSMLQGLVQLGGFGGAMAAGSPLPLVGSSMIGRISAPDQASSRLTTVTSADLVILAKEIEQAQSQLLMEYVQYRDALQEESQIQAAIDDLQNQSKILPQDSPQITDMIRILITNRTLQLQQVEEKAKSYRNLLVLSAGENAVAEVDKLLQENPQNGTPKDDPNQSAEKTEG